MLRVSHRSIFMDSFLSLLMINCKGINKIGQVAIYISL